MSDPPSIVFTPAVVNVAATRSGRLAVVPLICGRLFACTLEEPDGELLTHLVWLGPNGFSAANPGVLPAAAAPGLVPRAYVSLPPGTHILTLLARDESGAIGTGTLTVNVAGVNTNPGALQTVVLTDSKFVVNENGQAGAERPISVTFDQVTAPGLTWLESRWDLLPPPPNTLQAGSPPYYYEIKSNAAFTGNVRVCVNIRGMSLARGQDELQLHQLVSGVWTPLTNPDGPNSDEMCADAPGLGTFAIFYPPVPDRDRPNRRHRVRRGLDRSPGRRSARRVPRSRSRASVDTDPAGSPGAAADRKLAQCHRRGQRVSIRIPPPHPESGDG